MQYVLLFYEIFTKLRNALYSNKLIPLPKPEFYVLYNGKVPYAPGGILKLSDAFQGLGEDEVPQLKLIVNVINIAYDDMPDSLMKNEDIRGYAIFVKMVNKYLSKGLTLAEAIKKATRYCLKKGVLTEFLNKFKNEVESMFSLVYDVDRALEVAREEGVEEGREEGRDEGLDLSTVIISELMKQTPVDEIATLYNTSVQKVNNIRSALMKVSA